MQEIQRSVHFLLLAPRLGAQGLACCGRKAILRSQLLTTRIPIFPSQEFILHSPDFEAAKFWVGNLGKTATHAVVFAQLYMPDGQCHGLHSFLVQVRPGRGWHG